MKKTETELLFLCVGGVSVSVCVRVCVCEGSLCCGSRQCVTHHMVGAFSFCFFLGFIMRAPQCVTI